VGESNELAYMGLRRELLRYTFDHSSRRCLDVGGWIPLDQIQQIPSVKCGE
jgi:hypothetical protein